MNKYKYTGSVEVHLPSVALNAMPGDIIETEEFINHPEFELLSGSASTVQDGVQVGTETNLETSDAQEENKEE